MRKIALKLFISFSLILIATLNAQNVYSSIMNEASKLFVKKLAVSKNEISISFNNVPDNLAKYKNYGVEVYTQKSILRPGSQSVWVRFIKDDRIIKKLPVNINVSVLKQVVVATKRINRGKAFTHKNLRLESKQLGKNWDQHFFSINDLIGAESKKMIKKGTALTNRMVRETQMVHSGQAVNVSLRSGNLTISTKGVAKQNGAYGEEIKLKLDKTGRTIRGIVSSENLVIVFQE